ncbi:MAG: dTMP kinase, partial [Nannocystaceae bacterium]|nr:dTMP kinase [Nannocystaceae bacterium]
MKRGKVIAFEGVDGAGKSTVLALVADHLRSQGVSVFLPREGKDHKSRPTRMIRDLTRDRKNLELCARSELLMYAAREAQVLEQDVRPAIARGQTVLLDRSMWTPVVLGSAGRGLDFEDCHALAKSASHGMEPDTILVFDVHPRTSRIRKRLAKASLEREKIHQKRSYREFPLVSLLPE